MTQRRRGIWGLLAGLLAIVLLASTLVAAVGAGSLGGTDLAGRSPATTDATEGTAATRAAQAVDADRTRIRIDLREDGDATWTVELWTRLADDADEDAFASLQADVANDSDGYASDFRARMNGSVIAASDATGREMTIENVTVATRTEAVPSSYGVLVYEFEWTNFAAVDGQRLRAGDAIDGFLLEENTRLTIAWPEDYRTTSVEPAGDDRTDTAVVWQGGETDLVTGEPRVVVTSASDDGSILPLVGAGAAAILVLFVLAWLVHSGRLGLPGSTDGADAGKAAGVADSGGAGEASAAANAGGDGAAAAGASGGAATTGTGGDGTEGDSTGDGDGGESADDDGDGGRTEPPPELLSNEEQVLRLLDEHGGRMKQQQVVSELSWTEAKTSQVVTSMRDDEQIEVFRIGRENVLALPGEADL